MSVLLHLNPDLGKDRVLLYGRFDVPADMSDAFVEAWVYPEMRERWLRAMAQQGYELHGGRVLLMPKRYDHIASPDNGTAGTALPYEHDEAKRPVVDRIIAAYFVAKRRLVELYPDEATARRFNYFKDQVN